MIGAIIGDLAGSVYEYNQMFHFSPIRCQDSLIPSGAFYSDDTILTIAIADAIINNSDYENKLREFITKYQDSVPKDKPYFKKMFSPNLLKWAETDCQGNSKGNGAMMRISPVGWLFGSKEEVIKNARLATLPSHNSVEAIDSATKVALTIFYARQGLKKEEVFKKLKIDIKKPSLTKFNYTCSDTIDLVFYSLAKGKDFDDCIHTALSFGGDTDTNACIVGSMAEAFYPVEKQLRDKALSLLPNEFVSIIKQCEEFYENTN